MSEVRKPASMTPGSGAQSSQGQVVTQRDRCSLASVRRVAAMLDLDPDRISEGDRLPPGWHFVLLGADTRRSALRADGFPGLGVPMPDLGLERLMLGGRTVRYQQPIPIGSTVRRTSAIRELTRKTTATGQPMATVSIVHELYVEDAVRSAIVEEQAYVLLGATKAVTGNRSAMPHSSVQYDDAWVFSLNLATGNLRHEERSKRTRHGC